MQDFRSLLGMSANKTEQTFWADGPKMDSSLHYTDLRAKLYIPINAMCLCVLPGVGFFVSIFCLLSLWWRTVVQETAILIISEKISTVILHPCLYVYDGFVWLILYFINKSRLNIGRIQECYFIIAKECFSNLSTLRWVEDFNAQNSLASRYGECWHNGWRILGVEAHPL